MSIMLDLVIFKHTYGLVGQQIFEIYRTENPLKLVNIDPSVYLFCADRFCQQITNLKLLLSQNNSTLVIRFNLYSFEIFREIVGRSFEVTDLVSGAVTKEEIEKLTKLIIEKTKLDELIWQ